MADDPIKFHRDIEDYSEDRAIVLATDGQFLPAVERLLEDAKWQVERESDRPPFRSPMLNLGQGTIEPRFTRLFNGLSDHNDIPMGDYLVNRFGVEDQFDKLTDIVERTIAACAATREPDQTMLVWRGYPAIQFTRQLHPCGLLLLVTTSVAWI